MSAAQPLSSNAPRSLPRVTMGWLAIPSWLGSMLLHLAVVLLLLALWTPPAPRGDFPGDGGDSFRSVGIRTGSGAEAGGSVSPESLPSTTPDSSSVVEPVQTTATIQSIPVPSSISLPSPTISSPGPIIGAGPVAGMASLPAEQFIKGVPGTSVRGSGGSTGTGLGGPPGEGGKGTTLFGISDVGQRFVYVIDRSSSMATDQALQAAKLELLASLQKLDETQRFQVIFYNRDVHMLDTREGRYTFFRGTDSQRLRVTEQMRDIIPSGGTSHLPAILDGLKLKPDVLFLLTDGAAESALDPKDLEAIKNFNRGGAHIHCIEFGRGAKSPLTDKANFLIELSRENSGRYIYRDIRQILKERETP